MFVLFSRIPWLVLAQNLRARYHLLTAFRPCEELINSACPGIVTLKTTPCPLDLRVVISLGHTWL